MDQMASVLTVLVSLKNQLKMSRISVNMDLMKNA